MMKRQKHRSRIRVTFRDHALLEDLLEHRYLTTAQISRLHFGGEASTARRRLRKLHREGMVDRFNGYRAAQVGFQSWVYRLAREGAKQLAADLGVPARSLLPPHDPPSSLTHLRHHRLLSDFRIWVREGCESSRGRFQHALIPSTRRTRGAGRRRPAIEIPIGYIHGRLIPDAALSIAVVGGPAALLFVEVDCGTEPMTGSHRSSIARKMAAYLAVFEQRADDRFGDLFRATFVGFRVLCLVPDEKRRAKFLDQAVHSDLTPLAWVALHDSFETPGDLDLPIWRNHPDGPLLALTE